jgi:hypothetical protein
VGGDEESTNAVQCDTYLRTGREVVYALYRNINYVCPGPYARREKAAEILVYPGLGHALDIQVFFPDPAGPLNTLCILDWDTPWIFMYFSQTLQTH